MRVENWDALLYEFIESRKNLPFTRGIHDCCLFAADWVKQLTGTDYAETLRGTYSDEAEALQIISSAGGLIEMVSGLIGSEQVSVNLAQRGDVVAISEGATGAIGICTGKYTCFVGHDKMYRIPTLKCECAWRII